MKRQKLDIEDLEFSILTHGLMTESVELYNKCFHLWQGLWNDTFKELGEDKTVDADDFLLLSEVCVLHSGNTPVGLMSIKWINLLLEPTLRTSYFKSFPLETSTALREQGLGQIGGIGNLIFSRDFRRSNSNVPWVELLSGLCLRRVFEAGGETALCYTRNNRGVDKLARSYGGTPLWEGLIRHNVEVDIITIEKQNFKESDRPEVRKWTQILWEGRNPQAVKPLEMVA